MQEPACRLAGKLRLIPQISCCLSELCFCLHQKPKCSAAFLLYQILGERAICQEKPAGPLDEAGKDWISGLQEQTGQAVPVMTASQQDDCGPLDAAGMDWVGGRQEVMGLPGQAVGGMMASQQGVTGPPALA